jgi:hypothetical protein
MSGSAVTADPARLRALVEGGAETTEALALSTATALSTAGEVLAAADPRLSRQRLDAALAEVERRLRPLPRRYAALDDEVARFATALGHLDAARLPGGVRIVSSQLLDPLTAAGGPPHERARRRVLLGLRQRLDDAGPREVAALLADESPEIARSLAELDPQFVGRLDGAPGWLRDHANRLLMAEEFTRLERSIDDLDAALADLAPAPGNQARRATLRQQRHTLLDRLDELERLGERDQVQILVFDAARGRIAAARGDIDDADHVTTLVPGTGATLDGFARYLDRADDLADLARNADGDATLAAVAWLDYEAPPAVLHATSPSRATDAAVGLARFVDGLAAVNRDATRTLIGHSYGSTVVGASARKHDLDLHAVVGVGSPGMRARTAEEFRLPGDARVFTVSDTSGGKINPFSGDAIHTVSGGLATAWLGVDPLRGGFGADTFDTSDAGGHGLAGYLDAESVSGRNFGYLVTGQHEQLEP